MQDQIVGNKDFAAMNSGDKMEYFYNKIAQYHDVNLVKQDLDPTKPNYDKYAAPNVNIIYHFYNDGEITYEKGGTAYTQRSRHTLRPSILGLFSILDKTKFPKEINNLYRYCIVREQDALELYDLGVQIVKDFASQRSKA